MSEENLEIVRRVYERVTASLEMSPDLFDTDFEVDATEIGAGDVGVTRGLDVAQEALREYWETFEDFHVEMEEVIHADEKQVVTAVRDGGRIKGTDAEVRNRFFHVWTFGDRKIVRLSIHTDRSRTLEAAGLSE
jgi:ketosteroid isomerase-like protein